MNKKEGRASAKWVFRKLERQENGSTRELYQEVFAEDSAAFVDYYYQVKIRSSQVYGAYHDGELCGMVHLNEYPMYLEGQIVPSHYIVAVATRQRFRGQGIMRRLLTAAMSDLYQQGEPFTFLMPAAEAIYSPYDFRFVYEQRKTTISLPDSAADEMKAAEIGQEIAEDSIIFRGAEDGDYEDIARFVQEQLVMEYQVFTERTASYYRIAAKEQQSENGGLMLVFWGPELVGCFFYAQGERLQVREPVFSPGWRERQMELLGAALGSPFEVIGLMGAEEGLAGAPSEKVPCIMARIIHLEAFVRHLHSDQPVRFRLSVRDVFIPENNGTFLWEADASGGRLVRQSPAVDEGAFPIGELTEYLFGHCSLENVLNRLEIKASQEVCYALERIHKVHKIFINEVV